MNEIIDIHSHIIPFVDDGAGSMEQSLRMLEIAASEGISGMIATPHQKADRRCVTPDGITKRLQILQEEAENLKIPLSSIRETKFFTATALQSYWRPEK